MMRIPRQGDGSKPRLGVLLAGLPGLALGLVLSVLLAACDAADRASVTPTASPEPTTAADASVPASAGASPTPTPSSPRAAGERDAPYAIQLAHGEELNVSPAVVFVEPLGDESTAWVFPDAAGPAFDVSPDGRLIFWTELVLPPSEDERAALADRLFEELEPYLEAGERDGVREDLDALAARARRDGGPWVPIATRLVEQLRERLPPELAGAFKDRLSDIAAGEPPERNHLLNTSDGSSQVVDWFPIAFGPEGSGILALRGRFYEVGTFILLDGNGEYLRDLPHEPDALPSGSAWSPDGDAVAIMTQTVVDAGDITLRLEIWPVPDGAPVEVIAIPVESHASLGLAWSDDGERLALATRTAVRVFGRDGALLWEHAGEFEDARNLEWSPSGQLHLHTVRFTEAGAMVPFGYVFGPDGAIHFRVRWLRACAGDPWLFDGSGLRDGQFIAMLSGQVADLGEERAADVTSPVAPERVHLRWSRDNDARWLLHRLDNEVPSR